MKSAGRTPASSQLACAINKESGSRRVGGALSPPPPPLLTDVSGAALAGVEELPSSDAHRCAARAFASSVVGNSRSSSEALASFRQLEPVPTVPLAYFHANLAARTPALCANSDLEFQKLTNWVKTSRESAHGCVSWRVNSDSIGSPRETWPPQRPPRVSLTSFIYSIWPSRLQGEEIRGEF